MQKRKKLGRKMSAICAIFVLILSMTLGMLGTYTYEENVKKRYEQYAEMILRIAKSCIDVEDTEQCIQTREKSDIYKQTQKQLDTVKECADIEYLYVILPRKEESIDDNSMYIWSAMTEEDKKDSEEDGTLGDPLEEDFRVKMAEAFTAAMTGGDKVSFLANNTEEFGHMLTGMYPLRNADGKSVALVCTDISMNQIYQDIYRYIWFMLCGTLIVGVIFLTVLLRLVNKSVVSPVIRMSQSTEDFVQQSGRETDPARLIFQDPGVLTGDEIQLLCENLKEMTSRLVVYMGDLQEAAADKEHIAAELNVAANIKSGMLPSEFPAFPERTEFDIYASLRSAAPTSGNFYDFFLIDRDHLALVIGDVNGVGIPAALLIVITQTLIKNYTRLGFTPEKVFAEANNQLSERNAGLTTAAFLGILDLKSGTLVYVNAAHETPLLKHAGGKFEPLPAKDCFVLGSMAGVPYRQQSVRLTQGDMLFFYTKGLIEAENKEQVQYSREHMHMRLDQVIGEVYELSEILETMDEDLEEFLAGESTEQDITMLLFRYFGG